MSEGKLVFNQLLSYLPKREFRRIVLKYNGDRGVKNFTCWEQFLSMLFAQLTQRESLRDIEISLRSFQKKLYRCGIKSKISKSTLADENKSRDWKIYQDFSLLLIKKARKLYANEYFGVDLEETVYAFDASIVSLCLSVFPWAKFREKKGGIKLNTLIDLRGNIPVFIDLSEAKQADVKALDELNLELGAIYILDRGYVDFKRLHRFEEEKSFFIIRAKKGLACKRVYSNKVDKATGVRTDQIVTLTSIKSRKAYPSKLRKIKFYDKDQKRYLVFLTNNFSLSAEVISALYKSRWQVELFFKWIKQHLKIKVFFGTTKNAVLTQIWTAISAYVLVAIMRKELKIEQSMYTILQFLSLTLFEKMPILQGLYEFKEIEKDNCEYKQLKLLDI
jgi:hypothetical protein